MDWIIGGLPLHPLIVHLTVAVIPLAALCALLSAFWPAARRRLGVVTPLLAFVALVAVPITTMAGEWLRMRVAETPLLARHADLGSTMLPWVVALFAATSVQYAWHRWGTDVAPRAHRIITIVITLVVTVVAVGAVVTVILVGESGAAAVWTGIVN